MVISTSCRSALYHLLSVALQWPDKAFSSGVADALKTLPGACASSLQIAQLRAGLAALEATPLERVQGEYTRLFINGFPTTPCLPYESIYLNGEGLLGPAAEQVSVFYKQWGLACERQLPDHVAAELEFMHALLVAQSAAFGPQAADLTKVAAAFWTYHLGRWAPRFANDVLDHASHPFYRALASMLSEFIATESVYWNSDPVGAAAGRHHHEFPAKTVLATRR